MFKPNSLSPSGGIKVLQIFVTCDTLHQGDEITSTELGIVYRPLQRDSQ